MLLQGPIALGWRRWRELDQHYLGGILIDGIRALLDARLIQDHPPEPLAGAIYGALTEISLTIAATDDQREAREQAGHLVACLIAGIASPPDRA